MNNFARCPMCSEVATIDLGTFTSTTAITNCRSCGASATLRKSYGLEIVEAYLRETDQSGVAFHRSGLVGMAGA